MKRLALLSAMASIAATASLAADPDEALADPALEARAREVGRTLRCVVCKSQSIEASDAPLAKDLRILVRERIAGGDSDAQAIAFVADRYGDYVLLKPPLNPDTLWLWLAPLAALSLAGAGGALVLRGRGERPAPPALSPEEEDRLRRLAD